MLRFSTSLSLLAVLFTAGCVTAPGWSVPYVPPVDGAGDAAAGAADASSGDAVGAGADVDSVGDAGGAIDAGALTDASGAPDTNTSDTSKPDTSKPDASTPDTSKPDTSTPDTSTPDTSTPDTSPPPDTTAPPTEACARWLHDRKDVNEGKWTGSVDTCDPGDVSEAAKDNALKIVNLYRFLAHMPPVKRDPNLDKKAQACALMMIANNKLSHAPPQTWKCYSADGALAAKKSNLSWQPGVRAVDRYMVDTGASNSVSLGHRRWVLSRSLQTIGVGSTATKHSCLWVIGGKGNPAKKWVAWPSEGDFPMPAFGQAGGNINKTGWSLQSDSISFKNATVTVTQAGKALPVKQRQLKPYYGSTYAMAWEPQGWLPAAGKTYRVTITGTSSDFHYDVNVIACGK